MTSQDRGNFGTDRNRPPQAGQKSGQASQSQSGKTGQQMGGHRPGENLANDPSRAAGAGRKDGERPGGSKR
jgi:general stress protein YciG